MENRFRECSREEAIVAPSPVSNKSIQASIKVSFTATKKIASLHELHLHVDKYNRAFIAPKTEVAESRFVDDRLSYF